MLCVVIVLAERFGRKKREQMTKTLENKTELETLAQKVYNLMENGGHIQVIIHKTSDTNLTWYYSAFLWYQNSQGVTDKLWLNWFIAESLGIKLTKDNLVKETGLGTERGFQVAYDLGHIVAFHLQLDPYYPNGEKKNYGYLFTNKFSAVY